ncbi:hypothetical protein I317_07035 [Kwoniella heveanensis CBS 569]|nr:hypothetical protein I317_07035 [Kwoniella heveanensis CBS 569]
MPTALSPLPLQPPVRWTKPTHANTHGGKTYKPTHPDLFRVEFSASSGGGDEEEYSSRLVASRDFAPDERITKLTNISLAPEKAYSSVQFGTGPRDHLELNSDLLFMNHSCNPTAEIHLPSHRPEEWEVRARSSSTQGIKEGEAITFFYPSTEWDMAQGFDCSCGATNCLGKIQGAKYLSVAQLEERGYVNEHILKLKEAQEVNGHTNGQ